jgi:orsellinic acid C2-O-methyltransferase
VVAASPAELSKGILLRDLNMLTCLPGKERTRAEFAELFRASDLELSGMTLLPSPGQPYTLIVAAPISRL